MDINPSRFRYTDKLRCQKFLSGILQRFSILPIYNLIELIKPEVTGKSDNLVIDALIGIQLQSGFLMSVYIHQATSPILRHEGPLTPKYPGPPNHLQVL
jgi:hypothetical protein